jgi:hypothetical protein
MLKTLVAVAAIAAFAGSAHGATYVVLPNPGSMAPATVIVDEHSPFRGRVFVCSSLSEVVSGTCRLHRKTKR